MLPYRCIGLATFICIVTYQFEHFAKNQVQAFDQFFFSHIKGCRIYIFMNSQVITFSVVMWVLSFFVIWPKCHIIQDSVLHTNFGCDLTTNTTL